MTFCNNFAKHLTLLIRKREEFVRVSFLLWIWLEVNEVSELVQLETD